MAAVKKQSVRSNRCLFTLNFAEHTLEEPWPLAVCQELVDSLVKFHSTGSLLYAIVGKELAPTTGTPHLQGFIHMKPSVLPATKGTVGTWKTLFPSLARACFLTARGTDIQQQEYCSKECELSYLFGFPHEEKILVELGEPHVPKTAADFCRLTFDQQLEEDSDLAIKSRFQLDSIHKRLRKEDLKQRIADQKRAKFTQPLRPWQQSLLDRLCSQTSREVFFLEDLIGNQGKTWMSMYLRMTFNAFICRGGKDADIAYAFKGHFEEYESEYCVFDMARCNEEQYWPYRKIEEMKDGFMTSSKYESVSFDFLEQKVIVFCNKLPDNVNEKLSYDRIVKFIIDDNKLHQILY